MQHSLYRFTDQLASSSHCYILISLQQAFISLHARAASHSTTCASPQTRSTFSPQPPGCLPQLPTLSHSPPRHPPPAGGAILHSRGWCAACISAFSFSCSRYLMTSSRCITQFAITGTLTHSHNDDHNTALASLTSPPFALVKIQRSLGSVQHLLCEATGVGPGCDPL